MMIIVMLIPKAADTETTPHAASHSHAAAAFSATVLASLALIAGAGTGWTCRSLHRYHQIAGDGRQIERIADEIAERSDQLLSVNRSASHQLAGGPNSQSDLFLRSQQDDVR